MIYRYKNGDHITDDAVYYKGDAPQPVSASSTGSNSQSPGRSHASPTSSPQAQGSTI